MLSRRQLLKVSGSAAFSAAFRDDGEARVRAASEAVQRQSADAVAAHEDYWREIQSAFTLEQSSAPCGHGLRGDHDVVLWSEAQRRDDDDRGREQGEHGERRADPRPGAIWIRAER